MKRSLPVILLVLALLLAIKMPLSGQNNPRLERRAVAYWALQSAASLYTMDKASPPKELMGCSGVFTHVDAVLTAAHCLKPGEAVFVRAYNGKTAAVSQIARIASERDLAWLKLDRAVEGVRPVLISQDIAVGDEVWLVGNPDRWEFMVSRGIIRKIDSYGFSNRCYENDKTGTKEQQYIIIGADVYFGNSGGGLFDDRANLIGIFVRLSTATGPVGCVYTGEHILFGHAVGPNALREFLEGRP